MANSVNLDEIIFEERNKSYGAYEIRKTYDRNLITAIATSVTLVLVFVAMPTIAKLMNGIETLIPIVKPKPTVCTLLPPIEPIIPPPVLQATPPPAVKTINYQAPLITEEEVLTAETMPTIDEVQANATGTVNIDGPEVDFTETAQTEIVAAEIAPELPYTIVEQMPSFPGGAQDMLNFLGKHTKYPRIASNMGVEGTVFVGFVVSKEGSINEIAIVKGLSKECDEEAMRVVKLMPNWIAGKQNGKAVAVRFVLPIRFKLAE
jgi:protein TonB